jgi:hypothetical protein
MWGREPIEAYGCTEGGVFALQNWDGSALTLIPDMDFLEFIPIDEREKHERDPSYQPQTLLLDQVEAGEVYEVVLTNFLGGAYIRYRTGDLLEVTSIGNDDLGIHLPQFMFYSKGQDIIDLGSFCRLTERTIWPAIEQSGVPYADWIAIKAYTEDAPILKLYLEPANGAIDLAHARRVIHQHLCEMDPPYADLEDLLGIHPLRIESLTPGSFQYYREYQQASGADLAHLKPPHMCPSDAQLEILMS